MNVYVYAFSKFLEGTVNKQYEIVQTADSPQNLTIIFILALR